jgi:hypothetical protein
MNDNVERLRNWFFSRYERIEESTPRDSGEWVFLTGEPEMTDVLLEETMSQGFTEEEIEDHVGGEALRPRVPHGGFSSSTAAEGPQVMPDSDYPFPPDQDVELPIMPYGDIAGFAAGSDTSEDAAESLTPEELGKLQLKVRNKIAEAGKDGITDEQIRIDFLMEHLTPLQGQLIDEDMIKTIVYIAVVKSKHQSLTARRRELAKGGVIVDSGRRRKTLANRMAAVWVLAKYVVLALIWVFAKEMT